MPLLFSYGTLREERVQLATFGRLLGGQGDVLVGFEPDLVEIRDRNVKAATGRTHNANAAFTGRRDSRVIGTAFEVTDSELADADRYEQLSNYVRVTVELASGRRAWVYVHAPTTRQSI